MIQINIPNVTQQQRRMLDALWRMNDTQEVEDWIRSQPTAALQREAETMRELIIWACLDAEQDTAVAKNLLDKFRC